MNIQEEIETENKFHQERTNHLQTNHQTSQTNNGQKTFQTTSIIDGCQQQNREIIIVISFIEQTMKTLKSIREKLDTNLTQQGTSLI